MAWQTAEMTNGYLNMYKIFNHWARNILQAEQWRQCLADTPPDHNGIRNGHYH
jgi:hypothetical protein